MSASQGSSHSRYGAVTTTYNEHPEPLFESVLHNPGKVAARFNQVGFWNQLPGLHLMDHIHNLYGQCPGGSGTGVEYQLYPLTVFICRARVFVSDFGHLVISFVPKL